MPAKAGIQAGGDTLPTGVATLRGVELHFSAYGTAPERENFGPQA
jgi:hypothetical protein